MSTDHGHDFVRFSLFESQLGVNREAVSTSQLLFFVTIYAVREKANRKVDMVSDR